MRTKLGLSEDASIRFSRLHEGRHIDLEDGALATTVYKHALIPQLAQTMISKPSAILRDT